MTNEYFPDYATPPGEYLLEWMDYYSCLPKSFCEASGLTMIELHEVLCGLRPIDQRIAAGIGKATHTTAEHWLRLEAFYRDDLQRIAEGEDDEDID